jgi:hypothetical protein
MKAQPWRRQPALAALFNTDEKNNNRVIKHTRNK